LSRLRHVFQKTQMFHRKLKLWFSGERVQNVMAVTDALSEFWFSAGYRGQWEGKPEGRAITSIRVPKTTMKYDFVTLGFVILIAALGLAIDAGFALIAIDRLAQSDYTDIQNVMTLTDVPSRF
jgi:hypothetical protein